MCCASSRVYEPRGEVRGLPGHYGTGHLRGHRQRPHRADAQPDPHHVRSTAGQEIGLFRGLIVRSIQALSVLRDTAGKIESVGLDAGGVRRQIEQLGPRVVEQTGQFVSAIVDQTLETLNHAGQQIDRSIATQITAWSAALTESWKPSLDSIWCSRTWRQRDSPRLRGQQIQRLMQSMADTSGRIATQIVTAALQDLETGRGQVQRQSAAVQATMVTSLFTASMEALIGCRRMAAPQCGGD